MASKDDGLPQRPVNRGSRFSMKAATPSRPSSLRRQRRKASASRRRPSSSERSRVVRASSRIIATACGDPAAKPAATEVAAATSSSRRHDLLDEAPGVRRRGVDGVAPEIEKVRASGADEPRQPLRAAAARDQAELDLGLAELRVVGADPDVAAHRELEAAAEAVAVDRGDEGRVGRVHAVAERMQSAGGATLVAAGLAQRRELLDVGTGDEGALAGASQHDRARALVAVEPVELRFELGQERSRELVHGRVVDRDERDGALVLGADKGSQRSSSV